MSEKMSKGSMGQGAYQLSLSGFRQVYDFVRRYAERNENDVQVVLFTANIEQGTPEAEVAEALNILEKAVYESLRRSDISTRYSDSQVIAILMDANSDNGEIVTRRILEAYEANYSGSGVKFTYDMTKIEGNGIFGTSYSEENQVKKLLVVDDNRLNLVAAQDALSGLYQVETAKSGEKALAYLRENTCDLILLDMVMPEMDGFEVMRRIKEIRGCSEIPIIFLTGDGNAETEKKCLKAGAVDYIQKPFVIDVLLARISRVLELFDLRKNLQQKVFEKTQRIENLSNSIISALAHTIDAKDRYTSGHSQRVAEYSRMIAEKMGKTHAEVEEIYQAGLLHDVGKIRVPAEVINKPGKLVDEELELIKLHPITGYHILREISDEKLFSEGARFHHERYDGKGYPNGLLGEQIPEIARIVGVADAYDAMSSNRSYRSVMPQEVVREEIEKGKGVQFDPEIADIMLDLIDKDKDYKMKEVAASKKNILAVDEEAVNIMIIKAILKDSDIYMVKGCNSSEKAVDAIKNEMFDMVLLDVKMCRMDDYETVKQIRKFSKVPIVFMTADKSLIDMDNLKAMDIADFIIHPFKPAVLLEVLHAVLE